MYAHKTIMLSLLSVLLWSPQIQAQDGGKITGTVSIKSPRPNTVPAVVYLTGFEEPPPKEAASLSQNGRKYVPEVLAVTKGQEVRFSNDDKVVHNVFSMSDAKPFDLGEGKPGALAQVNFGRTGIIDVYCNIHSAMIANILVLPNRRFAYTDASGRFEIEGVPPGKYQLFVWHRLAGPVKQEVDVKAGGSLDLALAITLNKEVPPHLNKAGKPYADAKSGDSHSKPY